MNLVWLSISGFQWITACLQSTILHLFVNLWNYIYCSCMEYIIFDQLMFDQLRCTPQCNVFSFLVCVVWSLQFCEVLPTCVYKASSAMWCIFIPCMRSSVFAVLWSSSNMCLQGYSVFLVRGFPRFAREHLTGGCLKNLMACYTTTANAKLSPTKSPPHLDPLLLDGVMPRTTQVLSMSPLLPHLLLLILATRWI